MPSVQIKDVPSDVHRVFRRRAAEAGQSLQEYLLALLEEQARSPTLEELLGRAGERARLSGERLVAPELMDLEVASVWRRAARAGGLDARRAGQALADLASLPIARAPHGRLMARIWDLRDNLTPYDAAYVALAEAADAVLVTADRRLAQAPGIECEIDLMP